MATTKKKGAAAAAETTAVLAIKPSELTRSMAETKIAVIDQLSVVEKEMSERFSVVGELDAQIAARKVQLEEMGLIYNHLETLEEVVLRRATAEAEAKAAEVALRQAREREAAEFKYELDRKRKLERENYEDELRLRNRKDALSREAAAAEIALERTELEKRLLVVVEAEAKLEEGVETAKNRVAEAVATERDRLQARFEQELREATSDIEHELDLLKAEKVAADRMVEHLNRDLIAARSELTLAQAKVTEIAMQAVNSGAVKDAARMFASEMAVGGTSERGSKRN